MRKIIILIGFILLIGCSNSKRMYITATNNNWNVGDWVSGIDGGYKIMARNDKMKKLYIQINRLIVDKKESNCKNRSDLVFGIAFKVSEEKIVTDFLIRNQIIFDTSEFYIMKNNEKYKINLEIPNNEIQKLIDKEEILLDPIYKEKWDSIKKGEKDYKMNVSRYLLQKLNTTSKNLEYSSVEVGNRFVIPFGCQALEGTTLIIDGLYLNGEKLEPIEIKLSYKHSK